MKNQIEAKKLQDFEIESTVYGIHKRRNYLNVIGKLPSVTEVYEKEQALKDDIYNAENKLNQKLISAGYSLTYKVDNKEYTIWKLEHKTEETKTFKYSK